MAAIAWNLKKWLIATVIFLSLQKIGLFFCEKGKDFVCYCLKTGLVD